VSDKLCCGMRVKLVMNSAKSRFPEWMAGYHEFDSNRLPFNDRCAMLTAYEGVALAGDVGTVVGVHTWPERVDYLVEFDGGLSSVVPPEAVEFLDLGNIILMPLAAMEG